jgi:hypothetical protein
VAPDCPSFSRGALPPGRAIARYREVVASHVESFNYFLGQVSCWTRTEALCCVMSAISCPFQPV